MRPLAKELDPSRRAGPGPVRLVPDQARRAFARMRTERLVQRLADREPRELEWLVRRAARAFRAAGIGELVLAEALRAAALARRRERRVGAWLLARLRAREGARPH